MPDMAATNAQNEEDAHPATKSDIEKLLCSMASFSDRIERINADTAALKEGQKSMSKAHKKISGRLTKVVTNGRALTAEMKLIKNDQKQQAVDVAQLCRDFEELKKRPPVQGSAAKPRNRPELVPPSGQAATGGAIVGGASGGVPPAAVDQPPVLFGGVRQRGVSMPPPKLTSQAAYCKHRKTVLIDGIPFSSDESKTGVLECWSVPLVTLVLCFYPGLYNYT